MKSDIGEILQQRVEFHVMPDIKSFAMRRLWRQMADDGTGNHKSSALATKT